MTRGISRRGFVGGAAGAAAATTLGPWAPAVGAFLGLFITVGFVASGGPPNLVGRDGTSVAIGTWIQMLGVLTALVAGVMATRANYRNRAQARH